MNFLSQIDEFHRLASQATGLNDFGSQEYVEPLRLLLSDYDKHCEFNQVGVAMIKAGIIGPLVGRLFTEQGLRSLPGLDKLPVEKPLILVGMLRTGSTALHRLLAQDPETQWLPPWLGNTPMPRPPRESWESNPWYLEMARGLEQLNQMSPKIKQIHPMFAGEPDECRFALDQSFWSPSNAVTARVPNYVEWCIGSKAVYAYRHYRRVLSLIAAGDRRRWVLKDPQHLWGLDALLEVFPDACIVYTHRDPVAAMTSMASLVYELRRLREPNLVADTHAKEELAIWGRALSKAEDVRDRHDPSRFCDVHIDELQADPMATAERIYRYFDIPVTDETRRCWRKFVDADPRAGHGVHHYKTEDFGFTTDDVHEKTARYYERYQRLYGNTI